MQNNAIIIMTPACLLKVVIVKDYFKETPITKVITCICLYDLSGSMARRFVYLPVVKKLKNLNVLDYFDRLLCDG